MFKEILQIVPKISPGDLNKMVDSLSKRFANVAKKFGSGLVNGLKGGGMVGAAISLIDKLLNPIKEVQDAMDRTLSKADDLSTFAKQFGTTSGKLAKLITYGKATGLDEQNLYMLIEKFQATVAEAAADKNKDTSVRKYVGDTDTAASFFRFIQELQAMPKNEQIRVQQEVFGEKQILRMSDFLNANFAALSKRAPKISDQALTARIDAGADNKDRLDERGANQELRDFYKKLGIVDTAAVDSSIAARQRELDKENKNLANYQNLQKISEASDAILATVQDGIIKLTTLVTNTVDIPGGIKAMLNSRLFKGLFKGEW